MPQSVSVVSNPSDGLVDQFGTGNVVDYAAQMFPVPAALSFQPQSPWYIAQWGQSVALNAADYTLGGAASYDPLYGKAIYVWTEPETTTSVAEYQSGAAQGGGTVYALTTANTAAPPSTGATDEADLFLSSPATDASLSHPITLSLAAKIEQSDIAFATPAAAAQYATSGTVFGTFDIGFAVNFDGAGGLPAFTGYVQIVPWTSDSIALADYYSAALSPGDTSAASFVSSILLPGDPALSLLSADAGANPDRLSYNVNQYVYDTLVKEFANFTPAQKAVLLNLANWSLSGVYVGPATNDAQTTSASGTTVEVAQETVGIQISNVDLDTQNTATYHPAVTGSGTTGTEIDTNPQITYYDNTLGTGGTADGSVYSGPEGGIQDKYIYTGADSISLTATAGENWEFGGGTGLTELTAVSGDNIFVASTGSSYMVGGTGQDMFEIPDANVTGIGTWDSIENFQTGDQVTLAGLAGTGWTYSWVAAMSVDGNSGLTLLATSTTTPGLHEMLTLVGLSMGDLSSLAVTPDSSGDGGLTITRVDAQLKAQDLVTSVTSAVLGNVTSNIAGINAEYIYTGSDPASLTAPSGTNWEFGGGSAFTDLTATSGNNVFIASAGGSNMQGGSGDDGFLIPNANIAGVSVDDNITGFHAGDTISLAGLAGTGWSYGWTDANGTPASPALTLQATSNTTPGLTEQVTLRGLTMSDLASLAISHNGGTLIVAHN